jgi:DNA-3-methyladenine glycosylase II
VTASKLPPGESFRRVVVPVEGPLDLVSTLGFLHGPLDPFVRREGEAFTGVFRAGKGAALARLTTSKDALLVELTLGKGADEEIALRNARQLAGLPADAAAPDPHRAFVRLAKKDPLLADALRSCRGLRMPQRPDDVASVSGAVLAQQITVSFAAQLARELYSRYGERVTLGGQEWLLPPRAERLAEVTPEELRPLKISGRKAEYIRDLSREIAEGRLDLAALASRPAEEASASLVALRGIGPTTASWLLMFGAGHPDAWPTADVGLWRALETKLGSKDGRKVDRWVAQYAGYRSWLAVLLWQAQREERRGRAPAMPERR